MWISVRGNRRDLTAQKKEGNVRGRNRGRGVRRWGNAQLKIKKTFSKKSATQKEVRCAADV